MYSFSKMNVLIASAGVALLLASAPNANAAEMGGRGLRGVDAMSMDAVDADAAVTTKEMEINTNAFAVEAAEVGEGERALDCMGDGTFCDNLEGIGFDSCENCCSKPATFWPDRMFTACGQMPCWGTNTRCLGGTTCNSCCNGSRFVWYWFGDHCN